MGSQTMGSQGVRGSCSDGGATSAYGGASSGRTLEQKSHALPRQGSLYSLTLDEVQHQLGNLGKPLISLNLDELLKSVWTAEANQGTEYVTPQQHQLASASSLHRQSSFSLSRDLSKKTVDEVWQDIQEGRQQNNKNVPGREAHAHDRQPTLGEMTLEDFLVKAGVVAESSPGEKTSGPVLGDDSITLPLQTIPPPAQWMHYQVPSEQQQQNQQLQQQHNMLSVFMPGHPVQQTLHIVSNPIMDAAYPENHMNMSSSSLTGTLSDTQTPRRKRAAAPGDVVEKTIERRQKRMIKNRESAARSRARKQAYTHELENKVSRLEEENGRLKRQKEAEKFLPCVLPSERRYQLRRTSSAPF